MKKNIYIISITILLTFLLNIYYVNASSGALKKDSIKTCNGITYGQHSSDNHWHIASEKDGRYYATGSPIYSDPCQKEIDSNISENDLDKNNSNDNEVEKNESNQSNQNSSEQEKQDENINNYNDNLDQEQKTSKNNDNTLKSITINNEKIEIKDIMEYSTIQDNIDIKVETNDKNATYKINGSNSLVIGQNKITIEVTAEDSSIKNYIINIEREEAISSNTQINIMINNQKINFNNFKSTYYVDYSTKKINFRYSLNDENSKVKIEELNELKFGSNILNIEVIAEDGTTQKYEIEIYKYSKNEIMVSSTIIFTTLGGGIYGIFQLIKKIKR